MRETIQMNKQTTNQDITEHKAQEQTFMLIGLQTEARIQGQGETKKETGHSRLVDGSFNKQGTLCIILAWGSGLGAGR